MVTLFKSTRTKKTKLHEIVVTLLISRPRESQLLIAYTIYIRLHIHDDTISLSYYVEW